MKTDKSPLSGGTAMLILKLLDEKDMYGYQIIVELSRRSQDIFNLKTGTLYPLLHGLEKDGMITSYDQCAGNGRVRRYYKLTGNGSELLYTKLSEWDCYVKAVDGVIKGGEQYATA